MPQADTVGSIDFGILVATWSPDESLLALVTGTLSTRQSMAILKEISGDNKLILMTSTFDVIFEALLQTEEYGEGNDKPQRTRIDC